MRNQTSFRLTTTLLPTDTTAKTTQVINKVDSEGEKFYPTFTEETVVLTNDDRTVMETTRATCTNWVLTFVKRGLSDDNTEEQVANRKLSRNPWTLCFITAGAWDWIDKDDDIEWTGKQTYTGEMESTNKATYKWQLITEKWVKYPSFATVEELNSYADPFGWMFATVDSTWELYRYNAVTEQWDLVSTVALGTYEIRVDDEKPAEWTAETIVTLSPEQQWVYVGTRTVIEKPKLVDVLLVGWGWGGWWGGTTQNSLWWWWGWGWVLVCDRYQMRWKSVCVTVGVGWCWWSCCGARWWGWWRSCFGEIAVYWWGWGWGWDTSWESSICWSWWWGWYVYDSWRSWGSGYSNQIILGMGWGSWGTWWYTARGWQWWSPIQWGGTNNAVTGALELNFHWIRKWYSSGGGWAWRCTYASSCESFMWRSSTCEWSGGGWGTCICNWDSGRKWVVMVAYPLDWSYWYNKAKWWTKICCWDYMIHCFTSNWTFIPWADDWCKFFYTIVWWGWGWGGWWSVYGGTTLSTKWGSWWWGWGQVVTWTMNNVTTTSYNIVVWCWWAGGVGAAGVPATWCNWWTSCLGTLCANWWCWGWEKGWASGSWCAGGNFCVATACGASWGWGWSSWNWGDSPRYMKGWNGWLWMCGYWWWWGGWIATTDSTCKGCWCCGWWDGWCVSSWCNATWCWWWGGWWSSCISSSQYWNWGNWAWWIVKISYRKYVDWIICATWGTVTTNWEYTVHTFTSDWTFCIVC